MRQPGETHRPQDRPAPRILPMLDDIDMTGLADGDALLWDATAQKWKPAVAGGAALLGVGTALWGSGLWSTFNTDGSTNLPGGGSPTVTVEDGDPDLGVGTAEDAGVEYLKLAASNAPCLYVISGVATVSSDNKGTHEVIDIDMMFTTDDTSLYSPNGMMRNAVIFGTSGVGTPSVGGMVTLPLPGTHFIIAQMGASSSSTTGTHITTSSYTLRVLRFALPS